MEKHYITKNGVDVYVYENPDVHSFYISLFLRAGSMFEKESEAGISHFFEHIAIRNVNKIMNGELYSELDRRGIELGASTYYEMVHFYGAGVKSGFEFTADALCRLFCPIVLKGGDIDAERRRIKAEIREADDKNSLAYFSDLSVHKGTSLERPIAGTLGSIDKINARRLDEYRREVFTRGNFFFYVSGNVTEDEVALLISKIEQHYFPHGILRENVAPVSADFLKRGGGVQIKSGEYTAVRLTFDLDMSEISAAESDLIYDVLLSGYNSPFFIELGERRGIIYDISGSLERYKNAGWLSLTYELREKDLCEAIALTVDILENMKANLLSEGALMKASYTEGAYTLLDSPSRLNFAFAYDGHILGQGYKDVDDYREAYEKVTPERLRAVACKIFKRENLTLALKGNKKKIDSSRISELIKKL